MTLMSPNFQNIKNINHNNGILIAEQITLMSLFISVNQKNTVQTVRVKKPTTNDSIVADWLFM